MESKKIVSIMLAGLVIGGVGYADKNDNFGGTSNENNLSIIRYGEGYLKGSWGNLASNVEVKSKKEDKEIVRNMVRDGLNRDEVKREIDEMNKKLDELSRSYKTTKNGVRIYDNTLVLKMDNLKHQIIMRLELLRLDSKGELNKFEYIEFPLVNEIEHYGIPSNYNGQFDLDRYFEQQKKLKKDNELRDTEISYGYFKGEEYELFVKGVEALDFLDLHGVEIMFSPYEVRESRYGYMEDYNTTGDSELRRNRVYVEPHPVDSIISTVYHELGHTIYQEVVEGNEELYEEYYNLYKKEFDKNNVRDSASQYWDTSLTENFAEDFKIWLSIRVGNKDMELREHIIGNKKELARKDTKYELNEDVLRYFDKITKYTKTKHILRPDIGIKLEDYSEEFKYRDKDYSGKYINTISSNSQDLKINVENEDKSFLKVKSIEVFSVGEYGAETGESRKHSNINKSIKLYEGNNTVKIKLHNENSGVEEEVVYNIIR